MLPTKIQMRRMTMNKHSIIDDLTAKSRLLFLQKSCIVAVRLGSKTPL